MDRFSNISYATADPKLSVLRIYFFLKKEKERWLSNMNRYPYIKQIASYSAFNYLDPAGSCPRLLTRGGGSSINALSLLGSSLSSSSSSTPSFPLTTPTTTFASSTLLSFPSLFIFLIRPSHPPSGTPSLSLSLLNLSVTISVCQIRHLSAHPPMPNSFTLALFPPNKYSSNPPTLSIVLKTLACTFTWTNFPNDSDHSLFECMLGYHRLRVLISFFDDILLPNWMCEPP